MRTPLMDERCDIRSNSYMQGTTDGAPKLNPLLIVFCNFSKVVCLSSVLRLPIPSRNYFLR